jgi:hypothetical protein
LTTSIKLATHATDYDQSIITQALTILDARLRSAADMAKMGCDTLDSHISIDHKINDYIAKVHWGLITVAEAVSLAKQL